MTAIRASGGRKIVLAVAQLDGFMNDYGMDIGAAIHHPRIDVSGRTTAIADDSLPPAVVDALSRDHDVRTTRRTLFPFAFACPAGG